MICLVILWLKELHILDEVVYGAKFNPMFTQSKSDAKTNLEIDKLNSYSKVTL